MKSLRLSADLTLPLEAVTQKFAFLGKNGSGKTYGASKLAELMLDAGAQIVALDPVGVWYGLRLAADGVSPGIRIPVFGGLYGDLPLAPTAEGGALIADVIVDRGISAVIDVSQFEHDTDRVRFCIAFSRRIFFRKKSAPSAIHIFMEEAQEFLPQNPMGGEKDVLHEFLRIAKIGRNYGFGMSLISQRPQEINKKALNLTEVVLAFQTNGTHERKAIAEWVRDKGADVDIVNLLPKLKVGRAHAWSPTWLEISEEIHIAEKRTFNASATPKVGAAAVEARPLAPIDLEKLKKDMAATIEKKKAEDPAELKKQLVERDRRIRQLEAAKPGERVVTKPVVDQAAIDRAVRAAIGAERKRFIKLLRPAHATLLTFAGPLNGLSSAIGRLADISTEIEQLELPAVSTNESGAVAQLARAPLQPEDASSSLASSRRGAVAQSAEHRHNGDAGSSPVRTDSSLPIGSKRILDAIAFYNSIGQDRPAKRNVAGFCGVNPALSTWRGAMAPLRAQGLIEESGDSLSLSAEGRTLATVADPPSLDELHATLTSKLSPGARLIAQELINAYPLGYSKQQLASRVRMDPAISTWRGNMAELRKLALIDERDGEIFASDVLFPEGLA